jgi:hypothetical protein
LDDILYDRAKESDNYGYGREKDVSKKKSKKSFH